MLLLNATSSLSQFQFGIGNNVLWIMFLCVTGIFALSVFIFSYHWTHYGTDDHFMRRMTIVYTGVGAGLLVLSAMLITIR